MPIYQGTYFTRTLLLKDRNGAAVDITGWKLRAMIREDINDDTALLELTTDNGGLPLTDPGGGAFGFVVTAAQSLTLPDSKVVFDVTRTDPAAGPVWLFQGSVLVKQPVTRDG